MLFAVLFIVGLPAFLRAVWPSLDSEILKGLIFLTGHRTVRLTFSLLFQIALLLYTFSAERVETARTGRIRLRAAAFVVLLLGLAFVTLSAFSFGAPDDPYGMVVSIGFDFGFNGLAYFVSLILYNVVFKLLLMTVME